MFPEPAHDGGIGLCLPASARQAADPPGRARSVGDSPDQGGTASALQSSGEAAHWPDLAQSPWETAFSGMFLSRGKPIQGPLKIRAKRSKTRLHGWGQGRIYRPPADHSWSVAGPAMGPSKPLSSLFVSLSVVLWIAEKSSKKAVDGKTARGLYPAPHADGAAGNGPN